MNNHNEEILKEDEIDLVEVAKVVWSRRRFILKVTGVFVLLGLVIAFTSQVEYEASCKLMPESQEGMKNNLGGLGGLAGLAGINLEVGGVGTLTPMLYPEIVRSIPFQLELIHQPVWFSELDSTISSYAFFKEVNSPSLFGYLVDLILELPSKIKRLFTKSKDELQINNEDGLIHLTKEDWELVENYTERVSVSVDEETGIISVATEMPDPYAAAKITDLLVKKLTEEVTEYKIEKARANLDFIQERYEEAKNEYRQRQSQLANFMDRNKNITSSLVQTEYQRLQNEMDISFEVYKGLATQLEQAKIKVKEETPVFTVLEPVRVPVEKSRPKRMLILIAFGCLGSIVGVGVSLVKNVKW